MTIAIEKNVPLPNIRPGAEKVVPELAQMEILDNIYIPNIRTTTYPCRSRQVGSAYVSNCVNQ